MAMKEGNLGNMITLFIFLIVSVVLASALADSIFPTTDGNAYTVIDETITLVNGSHVQLTNNYISSIDTIWADYNVTNNVSLTLTTHYTIGNATSVNPGSIRLIDGTYDGNTSYVNYTYQDDNYLRDGTARTLTRLIIIFFVIGIFLFVVGKTMDMGIRDMLK